MASLILPLITAWTIIGRTIDIRSYSEFLSDGLNFNETDIEEIPLNELNSTYYVITDNFIPPSILNVPIDAALSAISEGSYSTSGFIHGDNFLKDNNFDQAALLVVTEYKKTARQVKENAAPVLGWQEHVDLRNTHYVDRLEYGGQFMTLITVKPYIPRDAQIVRRIFRDVMGTSGHVEEDTAELYAKALKALSESEDMRENNVFDGRPHTYSYGLDDLRKFGFNDITSMLKAQKDFPQHVRRGVMALSARYKPLHDLDEQYNEPEKNALSERYLNGLYVAHNDLDVAENLADRLSSNIPYSLRSAHQMSEDFHEKVEDTYFSSLIALSSDLSIYKEVNKTAFDIFFDNYRKGLDRSTQDYYTAYKRLQEQLTFRCEDSFFTPTRGFLKVEKREVLKRRTEGGLEECQDLCVKDERCRAVAYNEDNKQCHVYYRSTHSARILFSNKSHDGYKIYDRKCNEM